MLPLLLIVAATTGFVCASELLGARYRRVARQRRQDSFRTFQAHFRRADVHVDVLLAVQDFFQQVTGVRGFPVRPSDDLRTMYHLHAEDVEDAVAAVAAGAHCLSPAVLEPTAHEGVHTVEDLVYVVHQLHREARGAEFMRTLKLGAI